MQPSLQIAVTPGEPAGIGPEITLKLAKQTLPFEIVAVANIRMLEQLAHRLNIGVRINEFNPDTEIACHVPGNLSVIDVSMVKPVVAGNVNVENSNYVIETLNTAIDLVKNDTCQALTTGPVQKSIINAGGIPFAGHTEFIAEYTGGYPVMLLTDEASKNASEHKLRVALVTTHLAIAEVAAHITPERIEHVLRVLHQELIQRFGIAHPFICVCGLNPHAGEGGYCGTEEIEFIGPLLAKLRARGMHVEGPISADVAFTKKNLMNKDAIVAMYHDQGLPVIKHSDFGGIVNVTLGLPIIRTSVDHGTALNIAGQGIADVGSLQRAVSLAAKLASNDC